MGREVGFNEVVGAVPTTVWIGVDTLSLLSPGVRRCGNTKAEAELSSRHRIGLVGRYVFLGFRPTSASNSSGSVAIGGRRYAPRSRGQKYVLPYEPVTICVGRLAPHDRRQGHYGSIWSAGARARGLSSWRVSHLPKCSIPRTHRVRGVDKGRAAAPEGLTVCSRLGTTSQPSARPA